MSSFSISQDASTVSFDPSISGLISENVQDAIDEIFDISTFQNVIKVDTVPGAGQFTSIKDAVDSITTASTSNRFIVSVGPGTYIEDTIQMKPFVWIVGSNLEQTIIQIDDPDKHIILAVSNSGIQKCLLTGATGSGFAAIFSNGSSQFFICEEIYFGNNNIHILADSTLGMAIIGCIDCLIGGVGYSFDQGFVVLAPGSFIAQIGIRGLATVFSVVAPLPSEVFYADGANARFGLLSSAYTNVFAPTGNGIHLLNGATARVGAVAFQGLDQAIWLETGGTSIQGNANFTNNTQDIIVDDASASGFMVGSFDYLKTTINPSSSFFIPNKDLKIITVAKRGGDFISIADATNAITDAADENEYIILVGPGVYTEPEITIPAFVTLQGRSQDTVVIIPDGAHHAVNLTHDSVVNFISIQDVPSGFAALNIVDGGDFVLCHKVTILDCDIGINIVASTIDCATYLEYVDTTGGTLGLNIESVDGFVNYVNAENFYVYGSDAGVNPDNGVIIQGPGSEFICQSAGFEGKDTLGNAVFSTNGAIIGLKALAFRNWGVGLYSDNTGDPQNLKVTGVNFVDNTADIRIEHADTIATISANAGEEGSFFNPDGAYSLLLLDPDGEVITGGIIKTRQDDGTFTDFTTLSSETGTMGVFSGGILTDGGGLNIDIEEGFGYLSIEPVTQKRFDWVDTTLLLPANTVSYIYVDPTGVIVANSIRPVTQNNILLGRVVTGSSIIDFIDNTGINAEHTSNLYDNLFQEALGSIYKDGSIVTESGTRNLDITSGSYFLSTRNFLPSGGTGVTWEAYYQDGLGDWIHSPQTQVDNAFFDDGSGTLAALTSTFFARHSLYLVGEGAEEKYFLVYSQAQYITQAVAEAASLPVPPSYFSQGVVRIASLIVQEGVSSIVSVFDERPRIGFSPSSTSASTDHGNLTGLGDVVDHPGYLLVDGTRPLTGDESFGGNSATNVSDVNGVVVEAHAARHSVGGADALATGTPLEISDSTNTVGTGPGYSLFNHVHAHGNRGGGSQHAVVTTLANGFMVNTDKSKLDGIQAGATANSTDAFLLARANHTGTQLAATISDFSTTVLALSPPNSRAINSGNGLTGGGDLSADRTLAVVANADGSIIANADDIQVGVLATDAQHGLRGGGTQHAVATGATAGFMSAADKTKLDGIGGSRIFKSGAVASGSFAGSPKKATVTFSAAFPDTNYSFVVLGGDARTWTYESKLAGSIVINANANAGLTTDTFWITISYGETIE